MGNKFTNAQAARESLSTAFGNTEEYARRKRMEENATAADNAAAAQEVGGSGVWDQLKSMGADMVSGGKDMATDPGGVWDTLNNKKKK